MQHFHNDKYAGRVWFVNNCFFWEFTEFSTGCNFLGACDKPMFGLAIVQEKERGNEQAQLLELFELATQRVTVNG